MGGNRGASRSHGCLAPPIIMEVSGRPQRIEVLKKSGIIAQRKRRSDYNSAGAEQTYIEPQEIVLVGVSHGTSGSCSAVENVILELRPDVVVLEVCRGRCHLLYDNEHEHSKGNPVRSLGFPRLLKSLAALWVSVPGRALRNTTQAANVDGCRDNRAGAPRWQRHPRAELCVARKAALEVGSVIVLGDRRIHCALQRARRAITFRQWILFMSVILKLLLFRRHFHLNSVDHRLFDVIDKGHGDVDVVNSYLEVLSENYPALMHVLVAERDMYLAWSMKRAKAVDGAKLVVGVVGLAHMKGILQQMDYDDDSRRQNRDPPLQFRKLVR